MERRTRGAHSVTRSLDLELLRAIKAAPGRRAMLRALGAVDPIRALRWLAAARNAGSRPMSDAELQAFLLEVAVEAAAARDRETAEVLARLLADRSLPASPDVMAALSDVFDARRARAEKSAREEIADPFNTDLGRIEVWLTRGEQSAEEVVDEHRVSEQ